MKKPTLRDIFDDNEAGKQALERATKLAARDLTESIYGKDKKVGHYITFYKVPKAIVNAPTYNSEGRVLILDYSDVKDRDIPVETRLRTWKNQDVLADILLDSGYVDEVVDVGPWVVRKEDIEEIIRQCRGDEDKEGFAEVYSEYKDFFRLLADTHDFENYWLYYTIA